MTQRNGVPYDYRYISGEVVSNFRDKLSHMLSVNEGIRQFSILSNNCFASDVPFTDSDEVHIRITNERHDISQLDQTYLTFTIDATVDIQTNEPIRLWSTWAGVTTTEMYPFAFFVGYKNSAECFRQLQIESAGMLDKEVAKASFIYNTLHPSEQKMNEPFAHTLFQDALNIKPNVAGGYFSLYYDQCVNVPLDNSDRTVKPEYSNLIETTEFATPQAHKAFTLKNQHEIVVPMTFTVPIKNIIQFQSFQDWITSYGDIVLKFYLSRDSLVFCQCDSRAIFYDHMASINTISGYNYNRDSSFNQQFTQIGQTATWQITFDACRSPTAGGPHDGQSYHYHRVGPVTLKLVNLRCTDLKCDCYGFNVTDTVREQLHNLFTKQNPLIIPAQQMDVRTFSYPIEESSSHYFSDISYTLSNATDFIIVFPQNSNDINCFQNPMIQNIQLLVNGVMYPNLPFENSWGHRFVTSMIKAADFQDFYGISSDYYNSLMSKRWYDTTHDRIAKSMIDDSSFFITMQVERNSSGYYFDGLTSNNLATNINLQFDHDKIAVSTTPPQIWVVKDTFWTVDNESGLVYHEEGEPEVA